MKLLSTKVYWDNAKDREKFKNFHEKYKEIEREIEKVMLEAEKMRQEAVKDKNEYIYCGVKYQDNDNDNIYHYLTDDDTIKEGDQVIVPVGCTNEEKTATVVSVGKYLRINAPYPWEKTKRIIRKL